MKRAKQHISITLRLFLRLFHQAQKALLHFRGSCLGEGNHQNGGGGNMTVLHQVLDSFCYNGSFSRTGTCQNEQRSVLMTDRFAL